MATTSPLQAIPLPEPTDPVNVPTDLALAVGDLEERVVMRFGSSGTRDATVSVPVEGMVAWLQDENRLSIYDGTTWQKTNVSLAGLSAARPAPATLPEGSTYYETDTDLLKIRQGSAGSETWKVVNYARAGTKANRPAAADVPVGTLYYESDNDLLRVNTGAAWNLVNPRAAMTHQGNDASALTINATDRNLNEVIIAAESEVGRKVLVTGCVTLVTTDATSVFSVALQRNSVTSTVLRGQGPTGGGPVSYSVTAGYTIAAGATAAERTFRLLGSRVSGTGTAATTTNVDMNRLTILEIPV